MSTSKRQGYHHGDLKAALLAAADRLLDEGGSGAVSLREAARLAGASPAACYRHYTSKEDLLAALATRGFDQFTAAMEAATAAAQARPDGSPLAEMAVVYVTFAVERPARFRLMFGPAVADRSAYPALSEAAGRAFATLRRSFPERADRPGWADDAAVSAWALVHGLATLVVDGMLPRDDPAGLVRSALAARVEWGKC